MARKCALCEKQSKRVWRRVRLRADKYNTTIKRKQKANLQKVTLPSGKRVLACAKCIKSLSKTKKK